MLIFIIFQYIQYSKLKRIIKRMRFIADSAEQQVKMDVESILRRRHPSSTQVVGEVATKAAGEYSLLQPGASVQADSTFGSTSTISAPPEKDMDEGTDFFAVIQQEIEKINKFFVG